MPSAPAPAFVPTLWRLRLAMVVLIAIAFAPFVQSELFWDDHMVITPEGPIASLSTIGIAFFGRCVLFPQYIQYPYYRPLIDILFVLEYAIVGTRPFLYHLTNFLLHLGNGLMAFEVLRRTLRLLRPEDQRVSLFAFIAAGLFALHPIQVESVLWPAARPAVLSLFFSLIGALCFLSLVERPDRRTVPLAIGAIVAYLAGILSKEVSVALLPPLLLLLAARDNARRRPVIFTAIGGALVLAIYLILNSAAAMGAEKSTGVGIVALAIRGAQSFGFYLRNLAWPLELFPAYAREAAENTMFLVVGIVGVIACFAIAAWGIWKRTLLPLLATAGIVLFGGGSMLPLLAGQMDMADRYLYQSLLGFAAVVAAGLTLWRMDTKKIAISGAAILLLLTALTLRQSLYWTSQERTWQRSLEIDPKNQVANYNLALLLDQRGQHDQAMEHLRVVVFTDRTAMPERTLAALALGRMLGERNQPDAALAALSIAEANPAKRDEALILSALVEYTRKRPEAARMHLERLSPTDQLSPVLLFNLAAFAYQYERNPSIAAQYYQLARERGHPANPQFEQALRAAGI